MPLLLTGANVLLLVRDEIANDVPSLCREFGIDPRGSTLCYEVEARVNQLAHAGLIVDIGDGRYKVSENWGKIQSALGLSLTTVGMLGPRSMIVEPYLGAPEQTARSIDLFIVMPFQESLKPVWEDHIKRVAERLGLTLSRGDDFFTAHSVMSDVWNAICRARVIIADCTGRNPNVFYEIGLAHVIGKPVVLITQNNDDVPFDVKNIRYIQYEYTPRGMQQFELKLTETLKTEFGLN